jgi:hypothetical protein
MGCVVDERPPATWPRGGEEGRGGVRWGVSSTSAHLPRGHAACRGGGAYHDQLLEEGALGAARRVARLARGLHVGEVRLDNVDERALLARLVGYDPDNKRATGV